MFFVASANRPGASAYLMPLKNAGKKKGIPMKQSGVSEEKLTKQSYWILDGQHSIYAAKFLRCQKMVKNGNNKTENSKTAKRKKNEMK